MEVVGEAHYQPALERAARGQVVGPSDLAGAIPVVAELVPEPDNPYDANAVRVDVGGSTVGYLSRHVAPQYQPVLLDLEQSGRRGWCQGWIMGGGHRNHGIHLSLAEPHLLVPVNAPPGEGILDPDTMVAVVGEEAHQDALAPILQRADPAVVYAECRLGPPFDAERPRIEVLVDGNVVGGLTPRMTLRYRAVVTEATERHGSAACEGMVHRTPRGIEVELFLPRTPVGTRTPDVATATGPDATPPPGTDPPVLERPGPWPPGLGIPSAPALDTELVPTTKPGGGTRGLIARAEEVAGDLANEHSPLAVSQRRIRELAAAVLEDAVQERLGRLDVERLADLVDGQSRIGTLKAGGVATVAQVVDHHDLTSIPGIGRTTTKRLEGAAHQVAALVRDSLGLRFDVDGRPEDHTRLLAQLRHHHTVRQVEPELAARAAGARTTLRAAATVAQPAARGFVSRLFSREDQAVRLAVVRLERALDGVRDDDLVTRVRQLFVVPDNRDSREAAWQWFEADPPVAYGLLEELAGLGAEHVTQEGHLPSEIVAAVRRQRLDTRFLDVTLRGYQAFGARYALVQERVLIGDEMGLGKTIIALAVAAHLWAAGCRQILVVCPASVLLNWRREIDTHSKMPAVHLHGADREAAYRRWRRDGGVAVTTFGTVGALPGPDPTDLLVADEAHYVKNPEAQRSQHVTGWGRHADRVLYLTGTPLENRVEEFRELVGQLRPDVAEPLDDHFVLAGSEAFRTKVAPVYLRRNQEDVLTELPPRLEVDDWVEPTTQDASAYRDAVATGNFQAMRQAAWVHASSGQSAKMQRLVEVVEESAAQGWKVVVFSYFLNTLAAIAEGLDGRVFGPLTGATSSADRLAMVDAFTDHDGPAVLVSQIIAGGVGLNIQAASVVILAEPQWKPSTEDQAIARAHRMGQVRRVNIHRLLVTPGVDQRMKELVAQKAAIFDEYARQSSVVEAAPDAVDRTEASMVQQIIDEETARLAIEPDPPETQALA